MARMHPDCPLEESFFVSFTASVRTCLTRYADFTGRATRSEFWWFFLFTVLLVGVTDTVDRTLGTVASLAVLLPSLAVGARRLHDTGRSGWWQLLIFVPLIGLILLVVWFCERSHPENRFAPTARRRGC